MHFNNFLYNISMGPFSRKLLFIYLLVPSTCSFSPSLRYVPYFVTKSHGMPFIQSTQPSLPSSSDISIYSLFPGEKKRDTVLSPHLQVHVSKLVPYPLSRNEVRDSKPYFIARIHELLWLLRVYSLSAHV